MTKEQKIKILEILAIKTQYNKFYFEELVKFDSEGNPFLITTDEALVRELLVLFKLKSYDDIIHMVDMLYDS